MLKHGVNKPSNPQRVVVLGAAGFVGGTVVRRLTEKGCAVLPLGRQELDLLSGDAGEILMDIVRSDDSVLVISAEAPVKNNAMLERNIRMMTSICYALEAARPTHVVYISSDAVYADSAQPLNESSCAQPESLHGVMHLTREVMLRSVCECPLGILRPTLIYGANDPHNGYGPNRFRRLAVEGAEIVLFGEGEERRDHILVDDVADLTVRMLEHRSHGILNAATGSVVSFREIAEMVVAHFKTAPTISGSPRQGEMPHGGYRPFDTAATKVAFPDFSYTPLSEGLAKVHRYMAEAPHG